MVFGQSSEKSKTIENKVVLIDGTKTYVTTDNGLTWKMFDPRISSVTKDLSREFNFQVYIDKNGHRNVTYDRGLTWIDEDISSPQNSSSFNLEVNPNGMLSISTNESETEVFSLQVYDILGNLIINENGLSASTGAPSTRDLSGLKSGVYACRVKSQSGLYMKVINLSFN